MIVVINNSNENPRSKITLNILEKQHHLIQAKNQKNEITI